MKQSPERIFVVNPQGEVREVSAAQKMLDDWREQSLSRYWKDLIGRLVAIAGILIAIAAAYFDDSLGSYGIYLVVSGLLVSFIGRVIMLRAAYEPAQRTQDMLEAGANVVEKVTHWFGR